MRRLRALIFEIAFLAWHVVWPTLMLLTLAFPPRRMQAFAIRPFLRVVAWMERTLLGITLRIEGREHLPEGPFILASKHQSTFETYKLHLLFDLPAVILKRELMRIPIWGWFASRLQMVPIDRSKGSEAMGLMLAAARKAAQDGRVLVIYPQGTRVHTDARMPYKFGVARIYEALDLPVVPMALNSGFFWPRKALVKNPGEVVFRFLPPIPPGLGGRAMLSTLEEVLERESQALAPPEALGSAAAAALDDPGQGLEAGIMDRR